MFKKKIIKKAKVYINDSLLVKIAEQKYLGKTVEVNNGGGGYDTVKIIEFIEISNSLNGRRVSFKTDDSWISKVYYYEQDILSDFLSKEMLDIYL